MDIAAAQREMRAAYRDGAPGVVVSGLVWLIAGAVWLRFGVATGFAALCIGAWRSSRRRSRCRGPFFALHRRLRPTRSSGWRSRRPFYYSRAF